MSNNQRYQDNSIVNSTYPIYSEGSYNHIQYENNAQTSLNFEKFNKEITELLDQINIPIPDFFSVKNNSSGCNSIEYDSNKYYTSQQLESSQLDLQFINDFQKSFDKSSNTVSDQSYNSEQLQNNFLCNYSQIQYQPLILSYPSKNQDQLILSNANFGAKILGKSLKLDEIISNCEQKTDDIILSNESSLSEHTNNRTYVQEKITTNLNEHIDKLLADLEFIEKPLVGKRIRKTKKQIAEKQKMLTEQNRLLRMAGKEIILTDKEKRERRRQQINILMTEYLKNKQWSKDQMKLLAKQIGMSPTQIYKWNWDQRKKECAELNQSVEVYDDSSLRRISSFQTILTSDSLNSLMRKMSCGDLNETL
ncbi:UNKNOWN [Stylonychia lemnae]|uniref:Homeobox domain-containing protein n=1 Tax=Stylonychia lemnae TaxID=5949 RepID=A0A078B993_STYLE|nr:UNKNOWN [Stylonychia lemnae]|eukprot:CDW89837.1 UNKNOWN [Stylonychia lemnae]